MSVDSGNPGSGSAPNQIADFLRQVQARLNHLERRFNELEESAITEDELDEEAIDENAERIDELETDVEAALSIFDDSHVDKAQAHAEAIDSDAEEGQPSVGETVEIYIDDPPGEGEDPSTGVGRIDGKVTFVQPDGLDIDRETVQARMVDVKEKVNVARAVGKPESA